MATPTAPTVELPVQEPAPAQPSGPLASLLTPVQPARPVEPIGSTASMAEESIGPEVGNGGKAAKTAPGGSKPEHPVGALVRAIAARIGRTGTTNHVKRQHTITESRATGNQVNTAQRINRDTKHSGLNHRDAKLADNNTKMAQHHGRDSRDVKASNAKASTHNGASKTGRDVKDHQTKQASGTTASKQDAVHHTGRDGLDGRPGKSTDTKPSKAADAKPGEAKGADAKAAKPTDPAAKKPDAATTVTDEKPKTPADKKAAPDVAADRPRTQSSREAGYHDGTKAAKVAGHVMAYRDGAQDGWADGTAEYKAEKERMDDAKARNARQPQPPAKPEMQPASGTTVDLAKKNTPTDARPAEPVQVTGISASHVTFEADGATHNPSRAEVRTLRGFEQRMAAKVAVLQTAAEDAKRIRVQAADHAKRAQQLAEAARDVKGGDRVVKQLERLAEAAKTLSGKTDDIERNATRGAEAVRAAVANANTRHGGIYKAVADSPLTKPAEQQFYKDQGSR